MSIILEEGDKRTVIQVCERQPCEVCGEIATHRLTFLLPNCRSNPASKAYGRDDCSWCADDEAFVCAEHKQEDRRLARERNMEPCSTFSDGTRFRHLFVRWKSIEEKYEYLCRKCGEPAQADTNPPMCTGCMAEAGGGNDETTKEK